MPPKAGAVSRNVLAGRVGIGLKIGIVGLPNAGKSTLFNALTHSSQAAESYPFCTIDPFEARVAVPDPRFDWLVGHWQPERAIPTYLHVTDIAGLVRGASKGEGLGNAFLSHIKAVDAIYHVVRAFDDPDVAHVEDTIDPVRDIGLVDQELIEKDLEWLESQLEKTKVLLQRLGHKAGGKKEEAESMEKAVAALRRGVPLRCETWSTKEAEFIGSLLLLTAKPVVFLVNLSQQEYIKKKSKWLPRLKEYIDSHSGEAIVPVSAEMEMRLSEMSPAEREEFLTQNKTQSAIPRSVTCGYKALRLIHFFTHAGPEEAGGRVHTDFEKGFISADVVHFDDMKEHGTEIEVKAHGKLKQHGKTGVVQDGDIITFKCNAGAGLQPKKK